MREIGDVSLALRAARKVRHQRVVRCDRGGACSDAAALQNVRQFAHPILHKQHCFFGEQPNISQ